MDFSVEFRILFCIRHIFFIDFFFENYAFCHCRTSGKLLGHMDEDSISNLTIMCVDTGIVCFCDVPFLLYRP